MRFKLNFIWDQPESEYEYAWVLDARNIGTTKTLTTRIIIILFFCLSNSNIDLGTTINSRVLGLGLGLRLGLGLGLGLWFGTTENNKTRELIVLPSF